MKSWEEWTKEALEIVKSNIEHEQGNADEVSRPIVNVPNL